MNKYINNYSNCLSRFVDRYSSVNWSSLVDRGSLIDRGGMVDRGSMVSRGSFVSRGSMVSRGRGILGLSRVGNISNISTISIINLVGNSLGSAIRKCNRVGSTGSITISVLSSIEVGSRVIISYSIVECIHWRLIIAGLMVSWGSRSITIPGGKVSGSSSNQSKQDENLKKRISM